MRPRNPVTNKFMTDAEIAAMSGQPEPRATPASLPANTRRPRATRVELAAAVDEAEEAVETARQRLEAAESELSNAEQILLVANEALRVRL